MSRLRNIPAAKEAVKNSPRVIKEGADPALIFGNANPLQLEIGMGKGRFIMAMAARHPEINYIGVEVYESVLYRALQKLDRERDRLKELSSNGDAGFLMDGTAGEKDETVLAVYPNLRFLCVNAADLTEYLKGGSVDKIYLNFSDPWPKERHAHRRLVSAKFLTLFSKLLKEDGIIEFKTDNTGLFEFGLSQTEEAGYELLYETRDLHADEFEMRENVMTEYEEKFSAKGNKICKFRIRRSR